MRLIIALMLLVNTLSIGLVVTNGGSYVAPPSPSVVNNGNFTKILVDSAIGFATFTSPEGWGWVADTLRVMEGPLHNSKWVKGCQVVVLTNTVGANISQPLTFPTLGTYKLVFDWAAQEGAPTYLSYAQVYLNDLQLATFTYKDYEVHRQAIPMWPTEGENTLSFISVGRKSAFGVAVTNVMMYRTGD